MHPSSEAVSALQVVKQGYPYTDWKKTSARDPAIFAVKRWRHGKKWVNEWMVLWVDEGCYTNVVPSKCYLLKFTQPIHVITLFLRYALVISAHPRDIKGVREVISLTGWMLMLSALSPYPPSSANPFYQIESTAIFVCQPLLYNIFWLEFLGKTFP